MSAPNSLPQWQTPAHPHVLRLLRLTSLCSRSSFFRSTTLTATCCPLSLCSPSQISLKPPCCKINKCPAQGCFKDR